MPDEEIREKFAEQLRQKAVPIIEERRQTMAALKEIIEKDRYWYFLDALTDELIKADRGNAESGKLEKYERALQWQLGKVAPLTKAKEAARDLERKEIEEKLDAVQGWLEPLFDDAERVALSTDTHTVKAQVRRERMLQDLEFRFGVTISRRGRMTIYYNGYFEHWRLPETYEPHKIELNDDHQKNSTDLQDVIEWLSRKLLGYCLNRSIPMEDLYRSLHEEYRAIPF